MLTITKILFGFASIHFVDMRHQSIFPFLMPNKHFSGLSLNPFFLCLRKVLARFDI